MLRAESECIVTQQVTTPPSSPEHVSQPLPVQKRHVSRRGIFVLLVLVGMLLLLFTGQLAWNISQTVAHKADTRPRPTAILNRDIGPLLPPGKSSAPPLTLSTDKYVVYEQQMGISVVPLSGGIATLLTTPGYSYNRAVPVRITPSGQLLYSGNGLWLADIFYGTTRQIATLPAGQVITSMALSNDGTTVAWSTEPANGIGKTVLYAGPLEQSAPIYQHDAIDCPCYRVFSFLNGTSKQADSTLLLTDDRGDHHAVMYGLWSFNLNGTSSEPQLLLSADSPQGPLVLSSNNTLLYSTSLGIVPTTDDMSVPIDIASLNYANSLSMIGINMPTNGDVSTLVKNGSHTVLPEQQYLSNSAAYHWVTTPTFSRDGHTLIYVEFSSDAQVPFDRHNAVYVVHSMGSGTHLSVGKPQLLATSTDLFVELGAWINDSTLTFYSDGALYALDTTNGAVAMILRTKTYARTIAVVEGSTE